MAQFLKRDTVTLFEKHESINYDFAKQKVEQLSQCDQIWRNFTKSAIF